MSRHNIKSALSYGSNFLKEKGISSYNIDSKLFLMRIFNIDKIKLYTMEDKPLDEKQFAEYLYLLEERAKNKPVAYIINMCEFMSLDFYVDEAVLIPRPDTEILVELVIEHIKKTDSKSLIDIGTGSGCIPISIGHYTGLENITAVDIKENALKVAKKNAEQANININFILSNLFDKVEGKFDIIVSNPPYIETDLINELESNVREFEPISALDGGADGITFYKLIIEEAPKYLNKKGMLFFEIGYKQGESVSELLKQKDFQSITIAKDLSGLNRVVYGRME